MDPGKRGKLSPKQATTNSKTLKRKEHPGKEHENVASNNRQRKRAKILDAREIASQTSDKALKAGKLDVNAFVKAREFEIKALEDGMIRAKKGSSRRAFQQVPRDMRRRTASHNVKVVPKRLRARAEKEMKEDNTPTVSSRTRKPTSHMRLRLETAKRLHGLAKRAKARKKSCNDGKAESASTSRIKPRYPKAKKAIRNHLADPPTPVAKFRKRQINKSWLPTHIYHSKRAHMTPPKSPLWRFAIPITPTEKSYRPTHRATGIRGAVAWDMSYMSTIGLLGTEATIEAVLKIMGIDFEQNDGQTVTNAKFRRKWMAGTRSWDGWLFARGEWPNKPIAPATIIWCAPEEPSKDAEMSDIETGNLSKKRKKSKPPRRKLFIRVHPSAFLQVWNEVNAVAKMQRPTVVVEDLRFEIGSIEITGPGSTEALLGVLKPVDTENALFGSPSYIWSSLNIFTSPSSLPPNALLGFDILDPRLRHPPRTVKQPLMTNLAQAEEDIVNLLSTWPPDRTQYQQSIFHRFKRLEASRNLPSQKNINRRKGSALPGTYPNPLPSDPRIPILLLSSKRSSITDKSSRSGQGKWTVLLPWKCVLPVWYSLMHYPLSSGGNPRFGGLQEIRQVAYETSSPWFPGDYPGTFAGKCWEDLVRTRRKDEWDKKPKGKRIEWDSIPMGKGRKGEIGCGWGCDWEVMLGKGEQRKQPSSSEMASSISASNPTASDLRIHPVSPPPSRIFSHIPSSVVSKLVTTGHLSQSFLTRPTLSFSTGLFTIKLTIIGRGRPADCARIYRLPTTNFSLKQKWLSLLPQTHKPKASTRVLESPKMSKDSANNQPIQPLRALASSLLAGPPFRQSGNPDVPQAGDEDYPEVPDVEDLVGFVTTGNFSLGEGKGVGIGCLSFSKVFGEEANLGKEKINTLCIVRDAGSTIGRLGRWDVI